jgi:hypothetical protein
MRIGVIAFSPELGRPVSILAGIAVTRGERLSVSGSVWWFDVEQPAVRVTGGLTLRL